MSTYVTGTSCSHLKYDTALLWWLILARYYFFLELATRLEYKVVQVLATRFKYYKGVLTISNVFERFATRLKHLKPVLDIINVF